MAKTETEEPITAAKMLEGAKALAELYASVSYAGNIRPDPADADPDDDVPGDERDDEDEVRRNPDGPN